MRPALLLVVPASVLVCALAQAQVFSPFGPAAAPSASPPPASTPALSNWNPPGAPSASAPAAPQASSAAPQASSAPAAASSAPAAAAPPASAAAPAASAPAPAASSAGAPPAPAPTDSWAQRNPQEASYRRAPPPPPDSWKVTGLLGFEIELRGGAMVPTSGSSPILAPNLLPSANDTGQVLTGAYQPYIYEPFGASISAGYRFIPQVSVGGWFEYTNFQVQGGGDTGDATDSTSQLQRSVLMGGVYGRYYVTNLHPRFQPWVELGVGYANDTSSYTRVVGATGFTTNYYLTYQGIVTNVRVGLDWRLAPIFAVGPVFGFSQTFPLSGCADAESQGDPNDPTRQPPPNLSRNTCDSSAVQASSYGIFFGGIFAKVTLGPDVR